MIHAVRSANRCAIAVFGTRTRSFPAARKIGAGRYGDALQGQNRRAGTLLNINMADWSESELVELGPGLPRHIEASLTRKPDGVSLVAAKRLRICRDKRRLVRSAPCSVTRQLLSAVPQ